MLERRSVPRDPRISAGKRIPPLAGTLDLDHPDSRIWNAVNTFRLYLSRQASSLGRYILEQLLIALFGWIPTIVGIGLRAIAYKVIAKIDGLVAIENGVRLAFVSNIHLGRGVYLDHGAYLHACPGGITIGAGTFVMANAILHVYNFRNLPHAGINIGRNALIGEANVIRGQGGVTIGDNVYTAPLVQILAVNHVFDDPTRPIITQGITAEGIVIEDDAWIGAGAIITDGVRIGRGSVVGAGAVVTHNVPPHTVALGIPARVVRTIGGDPREQQDPSMPHRPGRRFPERDARRVYF